jgi:hypothetical protein
MTTEIENNWKAIVGLVSELKRCEECGITTASVAMAYICIDALANLSRPADKDRVTRSDFKQWVDNHLKAHPDQPYQYRGKDVYAARCALLHKYGSEAELHEEDKDTIMFAYHDGGKHQYNTEVNKNLAIIGTASFVNDVVHAVESFLNNCKQDESLRKLVEERLPSVLQTMPYPSND